MPKFQINYENIFKLFDIGHFIGNWILEIGNYNCLYIKFS